MIALVCLSVTASFWFMSEACKGEIMKPRRRPLRCLASFQNIFGREGLSLITRPERSHLARLAERMRERREETWRVLNRDRVAAFIELVTLVWVDEENCIRHASERGTADESLTWTLLNHVLPFCSRHCNDFSTVAKWARPMFMKDFEKMRTCLDVKFPDLRETSRHWRKVCHYYEGIWKDNQ